MNNPRSPASLRARKAPEKMGTGTYFSPRPDTLHTPCPRTIGACPHFFRFSALRAESVPPYRGGISFVVKIEISPPKPMYPRITSSVTSISPRSPVGLTSPNPSVVNVTTEK